MLSLLAYTVSIRLRCQYAKGQDSEPCSGGGGDAGGVSGKGIRGCVRPKHCSPGRDVGSRAIPALQNKEDMFDALMRPLLQEMNERLEHHRTTKYNMVDTGEADQEMLFGE